MNVKLLAGGVVLAGVGLGAYALMAKRPQQSNPAPTPSFPKPEIKNVADDLACAQVMTKCADGSWAPTPCGCRDKGGMAQPDPGTVIAESKPMPTPDVIAVAGVPVQNVEPVIAPVNNPHMQSDIKERDRIIWDRS